MIRVTKKNRRKHISRLLAAGHEIPRTATKAEVRALLGVQPKEAKPKAAKPKIKSTIVEVSPDTIKFAKDFGADLRGSDDYDPEAENLSEFWWEEVLGNIRGGVFFTPVLQADCGLYVSTPCRRKERCPERGGEGGIELDPDGDTRQSGVLNLKHGDIHLLIQKISKRQYNCQLEYSDGESSNEGADSPKQALRILHDHLKELEAEGDLKMLLVTVEIDFT
jgi:hypothetical protein